ncbi:MAG: amino acid ABC transporter permease, partial [Anaerolineae bacterium]
FLRYEAGFGIGEGPVLRDTDTYLRAFEVGMVNTARVAVAGVAMATALGLAIALARLSGNPLASRLAAGYVDLLRNTPIIVQLVFWYRGVVVQLPRLNGAYRLGWGSSPDTTLALVSQRGLAVPALHATAAAGPWMAALAVATTAAVLVARRRQQRQERTGIPPRSPLWAAAAFLVPVAIAWALLGEAPVRAATPRLSRFSYQGGYVLTPEYLALLLGLVAYTAAFIAEVFRSGIEAVAKGQVEAGLALGLRRGQLMRLVVLPQAIRVIIPPLTSQYLNLTKNSSLAIAIGYPDLFNVGRTISNQTGQEVMVIFMIMAVYLAISLGTSLLMNLYQRRVRLVER